MSRGAATPAPKTGPGAAAAAAAAEFLACLLTRVCFGAAAVEGAMTLIQRCDMVALCRASGFLIEHLTDYIKLSINR
jgi:hypothetical protein